MSAEYFCECEISVILANHGFIGERVWWAQATKKIDGISISVDCYSNTPNNALTKLKTLWLDKSAILPSAFSIPKQLAAPVQDAVFKEITSDDIPF